MLGYFWVTISCQNKKKNVGHLKRKNVPSTVMEMVMIMYLIEVGGKYGKKIHKMLKRKHKQKSKLEIFTSR